MENLKIVELKAAAEAAEDSLPMTEDFTAFEAAWAAFNAEQARAEALQAKFYAEYGEDELDSGICNARDTAVEYGMYKAHGAAVERSAEFWQVAIDSAQVCRDFK